MTKDEAEIRSIITDHARAHHAKNVDLLLAHGNEGFVSFDLAPPLQNKGGSQKEARREIEAWFSTWKGPIGLEERDLVVTAGDKVAFSTSLTHIPKRGATICARVCRPPPLERRRRDGSERQGRGLARALRRGLRSGATRHHYTVGEAGCLCARLPPAPFHRGMGSGAGGIRTHVGSGGNRTHLASRIVVQRRITPFAPATEAAPAFLSQSSVISRQRPASGEAEARRGGLRHKTG